MTQPAGTRLTGGKIALLIAAILAAFAIGYALSRGQSEDSGPVTVSSEGALTIVEELEEAARKSPRDAGLWQRLGDAYFGREDFAEAANAYAKAVEIDPEQALVWSSLGEARVMASERDPMPPGAVAAFEQAIALDSQDPRARYFLAVKRDLGGDHEGAIADWLALLAETSTNAPWRGDLIRTIEQVGKINDIDVSMRLADAGARSPQSPPMAAGPIPGPSAQDLAAASKISPSDQRAMAEGMVARLEDRLKGDPANIDGWVMLMRSRMTLGQPDKARRALDDAVSVNPQKAEFLKQQAEAMGVK